MPWTSTGAVPCCPAGRASVPVDGVTVTATLTDPATAAGTGTAALTATGTTYAATASSVLHLTGDLALNTFQTPYPAASAVSQAGYPPSLAVDGATGTFWVSGGSAPTPAAPVVFTEDFGAAVR